MEAIITDDKGILVLNFEPFIAELKARKIPSLVTTDLIPFINTLGTNKSGGKNAISRLQFFINAYFQEMALIYANPKTLRFYTNDHDCLTRGNTGTNDPDFIFEADGSMWTIDAKIFFDEQSYMSRLVETNFHRAKYALVYLIKYDMWCIAKDSERYENLYLINELYESDPWLKHLQLPQYFQKLSFVNIKDLTDDELPEQVYYTLE